MFDFLFKNKNTQKNISPLPEFKPIKIVLSANADAVLTTPKRMIEESLHTYPFFEIIFELDTFDEDYLLEGHQNFFDFWDSGLKILKKHKADILLRLKKGQNDVRLHFQTSKMYQKQDLPFFSAVYPLKLPFHYFEAQKLPDQITALIVGVLLALKKDESPFYRKKSVEILRLLSKNKIPSQTDKESLVCILYFLSLIYINHNRLALKKKDVQITQNLLKTAFEHVSSDDFILQSALYGALAQMYECAADNPKADALVLLERAIESYKKALKYINRYVFVYDWGYLNLVLSRVHARFHHLSDNHQALRDAIAYLKNAQQIFTLSSSPYLWAVIEDRLGIYLSLLSAKSDNKEIAFMAIECFKNKQKVYSKEYAPDMWAETQFTIGGIYDHLGRRLFNPSLMDKALDCYNDALEIFKELGQTSKVREIENTIARTMDMIFYHRKD